MPFFKSRRSTPRILPLDIGRDLEVYGRDEFGLLPRPTLNDLGNSPISKAVMALSKLQLLRTTEEQQQAAEEMKAAAIAQGGWALYGASCAIAAFLPSQEDSMTAEQLRRARIEFVRAQPIPDMRMHLSINDVVLWEKYYPGEVPPLGA